MVENNISSAFMTFHRESPEHAKAWGKMIGELSKANKLDDRTTSLIYLGILASLDMQSGIPFHVKIAMDSGASRDDIKDAILVGLPLIGNRVTKGLETALKAFDGQN